MMKCSKGGKDMNWVTGPPPIDPNKVYLNTGTEDQMVIEGYRLSPWRRSILYLAYLLTGGLLKLVLYWLPHWRIKLSHNKCHLSCADSVLLQDQYEQWFVSKVLLTTKDGTRIKVVRQKTSIFFQRNSCNSAERTAMKIGNSDDSILRYFIVKKVKYVWNSLSQRFEVISGLEDSANCSDLHEATGLTEIEQMKRLVVYGTNSIRVRVTPVIVLLVKEVLSPFYVFQVFSMCVWYSDEYYIYATCILVISSVSIVTSIYQTRTMQRALRNTIQASTVVSVCRGEDEYIDIESEDLVPGDVIEIPRQGCVMQCDAVLVAGNCIVDESMLTGESVPVTKTPLPNPKLVGTGDTKLCIKEHGHHVLFCGTRIIQTRFYGNQKVRAVVVRTGFSTAKGELVRSILFPKPVDFKFERDTYIFVGILALIAGLGFIYTIVLELHRGEEGKTIALHSLDIITITVPPALPAALTVGIIFAQRRLKLHGIYCISPRSINMAGSLNSVCFDKTGTLTEDGLMMQGVVPVYDCKFQDEVTSFKDLNSGPLLVSMATCHSLTKIDGTLSGDPLDLIMFKATEWELEEPGEERDRFDMMVPTVVFPSSRPDVVKETIDLADMEALNEEYGVVRQFTFSSSLQRMSVVVRKLVSSNFDLYVKGSPEMISSLSKPETVPDNFHSVLSTYTQHGYRVIALAWKSLPSKLNYVKIQRIQREQVEKDLTFLGLLIMENKLKPESTPVIQQLRQANIRTVMVTGDNILTALSVARECKMVDPDNNILLVEASIPEGETRPTLTFSYADDRNDSTEIYSSQDMAIKIDSSEYYFAVTGKSWGILYQHFPEILSKVVVRGVVFARMSPGQKAQLIEVLQELGYYVAMCGDGANDCGALKTAHTGISLSEAEASVASPFTSKTPNIECVPKVISQGRAGLVTSFGIFKYMACYSLTQFMSVSLLYWIGANLTDFEFLYVDLALVSTLSITFGRTEAHPKLAKEPPPFSLTSLLPILSLITQICIQASAQVFCFLHVQKQVWFTPYTENEDESYVCYENTAVFSSSAFQYIILAVTFSKGTPYRKSMFTNYLFIGNVVLCILLTAWITIYPSDPVAEFLELKPAESVPYRLIFIGIASINFLLSVIVETFVLDSIFIRQQCSGLMKRLFPASVYRYHAVEKEIDESPDWPPISPYSFGILSSGYSRMYSQLAPSDSKDTDMIFPPDTDTETVSQTSSPLKSSVDNEEMFGSINSINRDESFQPLLLREDSTFSQIA